MQGRRPESSGSGFSVSVRCNGQREWPERFLTLIGIVREDVRLKSFWQTSARSLENGLGILHAVWLSCAVVVLRSSSIGMLFASADIRIGQYPVAGGYPCKSRLKAGLKTYFCRSSTSDRVIIPVIRLKSSINTAGDFCSFDLISCEARIHIDDRETLVHHIADLRIEQIAVFQKLRQNVAFAQASDRPILFENRNLRHAALGHLLERGADGIIGRTKTSSGGAPPFFVSTISPAVIRCGSSRSFSFIHSSE